MEIRECLSVYLESGYLFDDMSGRLKWFEIDKILISFTYGVVRYVGTWGGCRTEKTLDGKLFYSSEECFKKGNSIPKTKLSIYDVFESLYGFVLIGDVWKYKNGRAVKDKLEYFDIEIDDKGKIYCKETYYRTREDVYKFNDLTVVDRNGDIRSENIERANRGESLAYTENSFMKLIQDNGITYNDVIQRGWI